MARPKLYEEPMVSQIAKISLADVNWLKENRYSFTKIVRDKIEELKKENEQS